MTRVAAPSHLPEPADAQIDAAVSRLVDLFARQAARELAADAPDIMETPDAAEPPQED
ncbi:hypothetical protein [Roseovarius sp. D0-M9]|uniref:hypothetical protein n=1 Tax=Roseovarius sp. D0-M9 TaxID=3127117 RepID=UPI00300FBA09